MIHWYIGTGLMAVGAVVGYVGYKKSSKTDVYDLYVEAASPGEVGAGVPSFYGGTVTALGQQPLTTTYSKQACVWYECVIEQEQITRDANGAEERTWQIVSSTPAASVAFALQGANGQVMVNPINAQVDKPQTYEQFIQPITNTESMTGVMQKVAEVANVMGALSSEKTRARESYIPLGGQLNVGGVALDQNGQKIFANDASYPLVLTPQSKADFVKSGKRGSYIAYGIACVLLFGGIGVGLLVKK